MNDSRPKVAVAQFHLRHLAILVTMFAVFLALVTPLLRRLPPQRFVPTLLQFLVLFGSIVGAMIFTGYKRQQVLLRGGTVLERFEWPLTRWARAMLQIMAIVSWVVVVGFFAMPIVFSDAFPKGHDPFRGSMIWAFYTFLTTNSLLSQTWWKIDPRGIEVCEHGLIIGSFQFIAWDEIHRVSWRAASNPPGRRKKGPSMQLNLFLSRREVMHFPVAPEYVDRLRTILESHGYHADPALV